MKFTPGTEKNPQSCGDCAFWIEGTCRRHAPVIGQSAPLLIKPGESVVIPEGWASSMWPPTQADEWCGDYTPAYFKRQTAEVRNGDSASSQIEDQKPHPSPT